MSISCISIDTEITINSNGSGEAELIYRVSQMIAQMGRMNTEDSDLPLPLTRENFQASVNAVEGLSLDSFSTSEDEEFVIIRAALSFDSIEDLNQFYQYSEPMFSIEEDGDLSRYTQIISWGNEETLTEENREFINTFFEDYTLSFVVNVPEDIQENNIGELASTRTVSYTVPLPTIMEEEITLEILW